MVSIPITDAQRVAIESLSRQIEMLQARYSAYLSAIAHGAQQTAPLSFQGVAQMPDGVVAQFAPVDA